MSDVLERVKKMVVEHLDAEEAKVTNNAHFIDAMRRVVVTGLGLVSPVGCGVETAWGNIIAGKSGASLIEHFDVSDLACKVAAVIPWVDGRAGGSPEMPGAFDPDAVMSARDRKRIDDFILYGIAAADEAIKSSGWVAESPEQSERAGVILGSGIGGIDTTYKASILLKERGPPIAPLRPPARRAPMQLGMPRELLLAATLI